jgi:hypothetical protein
VPVVEDVFDSLIFDNMDQLVSRCSSSILIHTYSPKQSYLLGRYLEPHICSLKEKKYNNLDSKDVEMTEIIKQFKAGRSELMKEKSRNIILWTQFLSSPNISAGNFLIPEINSIIANYCF